MDRLPADPERSGDVLPTPAMLAGIRDVDGFQSFLESLQSAHSAEPNGGINHLVKIT